MAKKKINVKNLITNKKVVCAINILLILIVVPIQKCHNMLQPFISGLPKTTV